MYDLFGFGAAARRGFTFESLRAPETPEKSEPEEATHRTRNSSGLVLLPPATWTDGPGGDEASAGVFDRVEVNRRNARDAMEEAAMLEEEDADGAFSVPRGRQAIRTVCGGCSTDHTQTSARDKWK